jgi:hypothetical protein
VYIRPGADKVPIWELWDPAVHLRGSMAPDDMVPHDVVYAFKRSWQYLQDTYHVGMRLPLNKHVNPNTMLDVLFYCDPDEMVMIAVGKDGDGPTCPPSNCNASRT